MKSKLTAEEREERNRKQNLVRVKKYYEKNPMKHFDVLLNVERYNQIDTKLKEDNVTKKQFLENAIDDYMKKE